ncbi:MAG TPA: glycosyltransferase [Thermodesulfobacteriota bacterium]|nr:glycosyltransferase [Thermodesulfobacteriota bacterium]
MDLSIVIPTYNRAELLARCLAGLARQEPAPARVEVVVVDDGSTDDTAARVEALARGFPFALRCVRKPNGGAASARNRGIREARGELVAFLDDDCVPRPDWVRRAVEAARGHPDVSGFGGLVEPAGTTSRIARYIADRRLLAGPALDGGRVVAVVTANALFRKRDLEAIGGFDERFRQPGGEDVDLSRRLLESGRRLARAEGLVVEHHHREGVRPFLKTYYWYGYGSGLIRAKTRPLGSVRARLKGALAVLYLAAVPLYVARHLLSGVGFPDSALYGMLDGLRKAAYALGKARGRAAAPAR